jgi:hypothetical protein
MVISGRCNSIYFYQNGKAEIMANTTQQEERYIWLRALDIIQQENIELKNQLAEMMKHDIEIKALEKAEYYQNEFLNKDTVIALLRHDIIKQTNTEPNKQDKLRKDMDMMSKEFRRLKLEFNNYLAKTA